MKTTGYFFLTLLACSCASSSAVQVQPVTLLQEWVGKPIEKLKKEWPSKKFREEEWDGRGKIFVTEALVLFPKEDTRKAKDPVTNIEYAGPAASDTVHFRVLTKFYVDRQAIIQKWEITQSSLEQKAKP